jgi:hypothetical protein
MLKLAGWINIVIAFGHLAGLIWAKQMFDVTGIGKEMAQLAQVHASLPYLLTVIVALVFSVFGLYGLSAGSQLLELPFLKTGIFTIAVVYLLRGTIELLPSARQSTAQPMAETVFSLIALGIGLLFLIGGLTKWR